MDERYAPDRERGRDSREQLAHLGARHPIDLHLDRVPLAGDPHQPGSGGRASGESKEAVLGRGRRPLPQSGTARDELLVERLTLEMGTGHREVDGVQCAATTSDSSTTTGSSAPGRNDQATQTTAKKR